MEIGLSSPVAGNYRLVIAVRSVIERLERMDG